MSNKRINLDTNTLKCNTLHFRFRNYPLANLTAKTDHKRPRRKKKYCYIKEQEQPGQKINRRQKKTRIIDEQGNHKERTYSIYKYDKEIEANGRKYSAQPNHPMIFEEILTCDPRSSWSAERRRNPRPIQNKSSRPKGGRSTSENIDDGFVGSVHGTQRAPFVSASKSISSSGAHVQPKGLFWLPVPCLAWILILRLAALLRCRGRTVH